MAKIKMEKDKWKAIKLYFEAEESLFNAVSTAAKVLKKVMEQQGYTDKIFADDLSMMTGLTNEELSHWLKVYKPKDTELANVKVSPGGKLKKTNK